MERLIKLEEAAMFGLSIYVFSLTDFVWWWYPALILLPDIGMLGYLVSAKWGAYSYNLFHHRGVAVAVLLIGWILPMEGVFLCGIILFGHCAMDRMMGYWLKYEDSFHHTHLGWLSPRNRSLNGEE